VFGTLVEAEANSAGQAVHEVDASKVYGPGSEKNLEKLTKELVNTEYSVAVKTCTFLQYDNNTIT
jgi:hypothetical protein